LREERNFLETRSAIAIVEAWGLTPGEVGRTAEQHTPILLSEKNLPQSSTSIPRGIEEEK
jgi:hypothetical protein